VLNIWNAKHLKSVVVNFNEGFGIVYNSGQQWRFMLGEIRDLIGVGGPDYFVY